MQRQGGDKLFSSLSYINKRQRPRNDLGSSNRYKSLLSSPGPKPQNVKVMPHKFEFVESDNTVKDVYGRLLNVNTCKLKESPKYTTSIDKCNRNGKSYSSNILLLNLSIDEDFLFIQDHNVIVDRFVLHIPTQIKSLKFEESFKHMLIELNENKGYVHMSFSADTGESLAHNCESISLLADKELVDLDEIQTIMNTIDNNRYSKQEIFSDNIKSRSNSPELSIISGRGSGRDNDRDNDRDSGRISGRSSSRNNGRDSDRNPMHKLGPIAPKKIYVSNKDETFLDPSVPHVEVDDSPRRTSPRKHADPNFVLESDEITMLPVEDVSEVGALEVVDRVEPAPFEPGLEYVFKNGEAFSIGYNDFKTLYNNDWVNDKIIDFFINYEIENAIKSNTISQDEVYAFNSFFFLKLMGQQPRTIGEEEYIDYYENVKRWLNKLDLFSYPKVILPINEQYHWYGCIIVGLPEFLKRAKARQARANEGYSNSKEEEINGSVPDAEGYSSSLSEVTGEISASKISQILNEKEIVSDSTTEVTETVTEIEDHTPTPGQSNNTNEPLQNSASSTSNEGVEGLVSRFQDRINIFVFDSLSQKHIKLHKPFRRFLISYCKNKYGVEMEARDIVFRSTKVPKQNNFNDCGIHVIYNIRKFLEDGLKCLATWDQNRSNYKDVFPASERSKVRGECIELLLKLHSEQVIPEAQVDKKEDVESDEEIEFLDSKQIYNPVTISRVHQWGKKPPSINVTIDTKRLSIIEGVSGVSIESGKFEQSTENHSSKADNNSSKADNRTEGSSRSEHSDRTEISRTYHNNTNVRRESNRRESDKRESDKRESDKRESDRRESDRRERESNRRESDKKSHRSEKDKRENRDSVETNRQHNGNDKYMDDNSIDLIKSLVESIVTKSPEDRINQEIENTIKLNHKRESDKHNNNYDDLEHSTPDYIQDVDDTEISLLEVMRDLHGEDDQLMNRKLKREKDLKTNLSKTSITVLNYFFPDNPFFTNEQLQAIINFKNEINRLKLDENGKELTRRCRMFKRAYDNFPTDEANRRKNLDFKIHHYESIESTLESTIESTDPMQHSKIIKKDSLTPKKRRINESP